MCSSDLEGIGLRRGVDWMADWVLYPKKLRPSAKMPAMLHEATAESDARAIAAYLGSLKSGQPVKPVPVDADAISAGQGEKIEIHRGPHGQGKRQKEGKRRLV